VPQKAKLFQVYQETKWGNYR